MSDTSLYSGIYQQLREYAELVDEIIFQLRKSSYEQVSTVIQKLGDMLFDVSNQQTSDLSSRIIGMMLENNEVISRDKIFTLAENLVNKREDESLLSDLQLLAQALEKERIEVLARIRGADIEKLL